MGRRPYSDRGKEIRRVRLALSPETWALLEKESKKAWYGQPLYVVIQRVLEGWTPAAPKRPSTQLAIGPVGSLQERSDTLEPIGPADVAEPSREETLPW